MPMPLFILAFLAFFTETPKHYVMVGSYTKDNPGIEIFDIHDLNQIKKVYTLNVPNASYQTLSANSQYLYSVSEKSAEFSSVVAFQKMPDGKFQLLNKELTQAANPCYVLFRESTQTVYTANYTDGSVCVFQTQKGKLLPLAQKIKYEGSSVIKDRQAASHAHKVILTPNNRQLWVSDLGTDKIYQHQILADGSLNPNYKSFSTSAGNGPRHFIFHPNGKIVYVINELSGRVTVLQYSNDQLKEIQSIPTDFSAKEVKASADIHLSKDAKWLVSSNRITSDNLSIFKVGKDGKIVLDHQVNVGSKPRNFSFDPSGKYIYVASQGENKVQIFSFNSQNGQLTDTGKSIAVEAPVCLTFLEK
jgi:6-phosphogluconolactonase